MMNHFRRGARDGRRQRAKKGQEERLEARRNRRLHRVSECERCLWIRPRGRCERCPLAQAQVPGDRFWWLARDLGIPYVPPRPLGWHCRLFVDRFSLMHVRCQTETCRSDGPLAGDMKTARHLARLRGWTVRGEKVLCPACEITTRRV